MRITTTTNGDIAIIIPKKEFEQFFVQKDLFDQPQIDLAGIHNKTLDFLKDVYALKGKSEWIADELPIVNLRMKHFVPDVNKAMRVSIERGLIEVSKQGKRYKYKLNYEFK
jgi:hypothetical protein